MKKYLKFLAIALLAGCALACSKKEPFEPYVPPAIDYEEVLSVNLGKVWEAEPEFPENTGYFYVNVGIPNKYYNTFETISGIFRVHNYGEKKLLLGKGTGNDTEMVSIIPKYMQPGDGIDPGADYHYYELLRFTCREGTYDIRMEFKGPKQCYLCTPKFRVTIGKDSEGLWTVALKVLEE